MKKTRKIKSIFALLMALVMTLGLAVNVFAAGENATITVTGDKEFEGKAVTAVQMFTAEKNAAGGIAYTLNSQFENFFKSDAKYGCTDKTGQALSDAAYAYISALGGNDAAAVTAFAAEAMAFAKNTANNVTEAGTATAVLNGNAYTATITGLDYGYYLVYPTSGSTSTTRHTNAQLISLTDATVSINLKSEYPTVDKKVIQKDGHNIDVTVDSSWDTVHDMELDSLALGTGYNTAESADAKVGDTISYMLTSKVPDMTGYSDYTFKFTDTLSKGLTFGAVDKVVVGTTTLTKDTDYTVTQIANGEGTTTVTIELLNFYNKYNNQAGAAIEVAYTATLNENAVTGMDANTNKAQVDYSNDPSNSTTTVPSKPDEVPVYTFDFTIDKYTGEYNDTATRLAGAVFELRTTADATGTPISLVQVNAGNAADPAVYRVAKTGETGVTTVTTPESGKIQIKGLDAGTYYLHETKAPTGYNKLAAPVKIVIAATYNTDTQKLESFTITYGDPSVTATDGVIPVQNNSGTTLPSTGGLGTLLLALAGVGLVIFGVVRRDRRKKGVC